MVVGVNLNIKNKVEFNMKCILDMFIGWCGKIWKK